ncbi:uncharacterized protein LOC121385553 [Gigantopelta aegis]|uniref:uncharacterized protein LOC121385553 n=1 Tax=Gigantopelta aegis TaxID=1735272 RepID=UPI001B88A8CD|nr:uncharacterized protein LOC121385553 [Gigantopelta aegis]
MRGLTVSVLLLLVAFAIPATQGAKYCKCSIIDAHAPGIVIHTFERYRVCGWLCGCKRALRECVQNCQRRVKEWYCYGNCNNRPGVQIRGRYEVGNNRRPTRCGAANLVDIRVCGSTTCCGAGK